MLVNEQEQKCIRVLTKLFSDGEIQQTYVKMKESLKNNGLDLNKIEYENLMSMMEQGGIIEDCHHCQASRFFVFKISPTVVQAARVLDKVEEKANEPGDIVQQVQEKARRHPAIAYVIILFFVLAALVTVINSGYDLLVKIGIIKSATPSAPVINNYYPPPETKPDAVKDK